MEKMDNPKVKNTYIKYSAHLNKAVKLICKILTLHLYDHINMHIVAL